MDGDLLYEQLVDVLLHPTSSRLHPIKQSTPLRKSTLNGFNYDK